MDDDELLAALGRMNPVRREQVAGSANSFAAGALLEEVIRAPRSRRYRRSVAESIRRARVLDGLDPLDALRTANPAPGTAAQASISANEDAKRAALLDSIITGGPVPAAAGIGAWIGGFVAAFSALPLRLFRRLRPAAGAAPRHLGRTRRVVLLSVIGVGALAGAATGYVLTRSHPTGQLTACFGSDSSASIVEGGGDVVVVPGTADVGGCQQLWLSGRFGAPRIPHLISCVLRSGWVGVFPGATDQVCVRLRLSVAYPPSAEVAAESKLRLALDTDLAYSKCVPLVAACVIVRRELDRFGLSGWHEVVSNVGQVTPTECTTIEIAPPDTVRIAELPKVALPGKSSRPALPVPTTS